MRGLHDAQADRFVDGRVFALAKQLEHNSRRRSTVFAARTVTTSPQSSPQSRRAKCYKHAYLTKSGDLGVVLQVHGVDYECLDGNALDMPTKRLESALRLLDTNFRVYQYLFKRNHETIPHRKYPNAFDRSC